MDFKRIVFNSLGILSLLMVLILPYSLVGKANVVSLFLEPILGILIYVLLNMVSAPIFAKLLNVSFPDLDEFILFLFSPFFFFHKRIYYADLGYFYISGSETITVRKIEYLYTRTLFEVNYNGDVEKLRLDIKSKLDSIYAEELDKKRKVKKLKDWNGYLDKQSERDDKLKQILN
jgi:hypothetical protein